MRRLTFSLLCLAAMGVGWIAYDLGEVQQKSTGVPSGAAAIGPAHPAAGRRVYLQRSDQRQATEGNGFARPPLSLLKVGERMEYGDFHWDEQGVPEGPVFVRVDLRTQIMNVFRAGHEIGTAVVLYGADKKETPTGRFPILWKKQDHRSSLYDAPMPYTLRLTGDGVAIHGSNVRWGAATHGCVGIPSAFAARLFEEVKVGDPVLIVRTSRIS
jgi:hypothetical protein